MKYLYFLLICFLVLGCAETNVLYKKPDDTLTAKVEFPTGPIVVGYFENGADCTGKRYFDEKSNPYINGNLNVHVPAEKRIAISMMEITPTYQCDVILSFIPKQNKSYKIWFQPLNRATNSCKGGLNVIKNGVEISALEEEVTPMAWNFSFANTCHPIALKK